MIDFEKITIEQSTKLARIEESLISIKNSISKLEMNPKDYVTCKVFFFTVTIITSVVGYLFIK